MKDINGKVIWIIGCSSGIGFALAKELSELGAILILSARRENKLEDLNNNLGGNHLVCPVDVESHKSIINAVNIIKEIYPNIDSAIFLPAIYLPHDGNKKDIKIIHKMLSVNIGGAFNMVDVLLPIFEKQKFGQIILCASVAGYRGLPMGQPYCASKAAIISYAESLKTELEHKNIDVKVINPGFVRTPLTDKNDFPMPMIIEPDIAAKAIIRGIKSRVFEIHFPKKFTYIMKILHILPAPLYFFIMRIIQKFIKK